MGSACYWIGEGFGLGFYLAVASPDPFGAWLLDSQQRAWLGALVASHLVRFFLFVRERAALLGSGALEPAHWNVMEFSAALLGPGSSDHVFGLKSLVKTGGGTQ